MLRTRDARPCGVDDGFPLKCDPAIDSAGLRGRSADPISRRIGKFQRGLWGWLLREEDQAKWALHCEFEGSIGIGLPIIYFFACLYLTRDHVGPGRAFRSTVSICIQSICSITWTRTIQVKGLASLRNRRSVDTVRARNAAVAAIRDDTRITCCERLRPSSDLLARYTHLFHSSAFPEFHL